MLRSIQSCSKVGFSVTFIRQAISVRKAWFAEVCVRGRLCASPHHWNRNIFSDPLSDDLAPAEISREFDSGRPWLFASLVQ